jgi:hypothetical protein
MAAMLSEASPRWVRRSELAMSIGPKAAGVCLALCLVLGGAHPSRADVAVRAGPRSGVEAHDGADLAVGADLRLAFSLSPLTLNPSFDYFFADGQTLYQIGLNALYHLPIGSRSRVAPYGGIGVGLTFFSMEEAPDVTDAHGSRVGLNVITGVCFDLPIVAPYAQMTATVGEIDLVAITAGLLYDFGQGGDGGGWDRCGRRRPQPEAGR